MKKRNPIVKILYKFKQRIIRNKTKYNRNSKHKLNIKEL